MVSIRIVIQYMKVHMTKAGRCPKILVSSFKEPHRTAEEGSKEYNKNVISLEWTWLRRKEGSPSSFPFERKKNKGRHDNYI